MPICPLASEILLFGLHHLLMLTVRLWGLQLGSLRFGHPFLSFGLVESRELSLLHFALKALNCYV